MTGIYSWQKPTFVLVKENALKWQSNFIFDKVPTKVLTVTTKHKQLIRKEEPLTVKIIIVLMQYPTVFLLDENMFKTIYKTENIYNDIVYKGHRSQQWVGHVIVYKLSKLRTVSQPFVPNVQLHVQSQQKKKKRLLECKKNKTHVIMLSL